MDPLSQAVTGAALAGCFAKKSTIRSALLLGACAGMVPDLDILIRSGTDPLLALEYHRHFTHAMAFSPIGGLLVAAFFWLFPAIRKRLSFKQAWLFSFLGMLTHGIIDSCTGYGTHLFWPFTNTRESWNVIGIIDIFYLIPALFFVILAAMLKKITLPKIAAIWIVAYLALGAFQHARTTSVAKEWLAEQNIAYENLAIRPTISNLWLWRMLYKDVEADRWQAHALFIPFWSHDNRIKLGESSAIFEEKFPPDSQTAKDIARFYFFSDGYLSRHDRADGSYWIGDARYGLTPDSAHPLWGIEPSGNINTHVIRHSSTRGSLNWHEVEKLLKGEGFTPIR